MAKSNWKLLLLVTVLIQVFTDGLFVFETLGIYSPLITQIKGFFPLWFFPRRIFWFTLGIVASTYRQPLSEWLARVKWQLLAAAIVLGVGSMVEYHFFARLLGEEWLGPSFRGISNRLYALFFILCILAFNDISLPFSKQISELGSKSLGIYLANIPVIYIFSVIMYEEAPWMLSNQFVYQTILVFVGLAIPLLLMSLAKRTPARKVYRYIYG
jgi:peptidoglycan/LPS O-acetylase OafA/YrhL